MPLILPGNVGSATAATGYNVANSVRFNSGSSDYLNRTPSSAGNLRTWTYSVWVKKSANGVNNYLLSAADDANNTVNIWINDGDVLECQIKSSGNNYKLSTNRLFRDVSAWYHIVFAVDTTQGTESNRFKIYVNGVQETSLATANYPSQNTDGVLNSQTQTNIGKYDLGSTYINGYLSEVVLVDGSQLAADQFGEFDSNSGIWKPIDVSGLTFGTNGFYLEFKESGTSQNASGLGADTSGNTNHLAVNNLTAVDQSIDTCTNNFATLNSIDKGYGTTVYTEGNLNATSSSGWNPSRGTIAVTSGKWYWEIVSGNSFQIGVCSDTIDFANNDNAQDLTGVTVFYNASGGIIRTDGSTVGGTTATVDANDTMGFALDMDNKKLSVYKNNSIIVTNTALSTSITDVAMIFGTTNDGGDFKINFGSPMYAISSGNTDGNSYGNFEYSVPSGYFSLNTKNLAEYG